MMQDYRAGITDHDVFMSTPQLVAMHGEVGDLEDLNPYIKRDWPASKQAGVDWTSTWAQGQYNGKQIIVPTGSHARFFVWNKEMFSAAGLDPNTPPKTFDEMISFAQKLTKDTNGDGIPDQYGLGLTLGPDRATIEASFGPLIWGMGGDFFDTTTGKAIFANDNGIKAAELLWDLVNTYKVIAPSALVSDYNRNVLDAMLDGKAAMVYGWGTYFMPNAQDAGWVSGINPPAANSQLTKLGVGQYPSASGQPGPGFVNAWGISMYAGSKNKEMAWKFIDTLLNSPDLTSWGDAGMPLQKAEWDVPAYQGEYFKQVLEAIGIGEGMPKSPYFGELADIVSAALQQCMSGPKANVKQIMTDAQTQFNTRYAQ
jgi:multiple sugar transport system substrate-binding protein